MWCCTQSLGLTLPLSLPFLLSFSSVPSLNYTEYLQGPHTCHDAQVEAKEQLPGVVLSSFDCGFPENKPGASVGLGGKCLYLLSYLVGFPLLFFRQDLLM